LVESRGETFCLMLLNNAFVPCGVAGHVFASMLSRSRYEGGAIAILAVRVQV